MGRSASALRAHAFPLLAQGVHKGGLLRILYKQLIASVCRVRQTGPNDRVTHPINELSVFRICNFRLIHPECFERYSFRFGIEAFSWTLWNFT